MNKQKNVVQNAVNQLTVSHSHAIIVTKVTTYIQIDRHIQIYINKKNLKRLPGKENKRERMQLPRIKFEHQKLEQLNDYAQHKWKIRQDHNAQQKRKKKKEEKKNQSPVCREGIIST